MRHGSTQPDKQFQFLKSKASRYALYGVLIAGTSVVIATILVSYVMQNAVSLDGIIAAQRSNAALWILDVLPFIFALWGQYASGRMAREADDLLEHETRSLRQELTEAKYTSRSKSDFLAKMSHELRTPMNGIMGMTDLLLQTRLDSEQRRYADIIQSSAAGLLTLINDILDYSKIEAGKLNLEEIEFDFRECIEGAVALLINQAQQKGLLLTALLQPGIPQRLIGDPGRLRQIVINLLSNAIKFTDIGEVVLSAKKTLEDTGGQVLLRIEVSDTGIGIPETVRDRLFQSYSQADVSTTRKYGGTGLGLAITRELVEAMGGKINVVSKEKQGSAFWFTVNLKKPREDTKARSVDRIELKGLRVLVADANVEARAILADQLRVLGMEVETTGDGATALQTITAAAESGPPFDLLLTEMFLPILSGEELGRAIKQNDKTRNTILVLITSAGERGDAQRLNQIGFAGYFSGSIAPGDLHDMLTAVLHTRGIGEERRQAHGPVTKYTLAEKRRKNQHILLAEDSETNREIMLNTLSGLGYRADVAVNGREVLEAVRRKDFGLILLDLRMPQMNGLRSLEAIRNLPDARARVPVVMLTAGATDEEEKRSRELGVNDFLTKPVDNALLVQTLTRWVGPAPLTRLDNDQASKTDANKTIGVSTQLINIFLQESSARLDALRNALAAADAGRVVREAHTLKSTSKHFLEGDAQMHSVAARLEKLAEAGDLSQATAVADELDSAFAVLRDKLERELARRS